MNDALYLFATYCLMGKIKNVDIEEVEEALLSIEENFVNTGLINKKDLENNIIPDIDYKLQQEIGRYIPLKYADICKKKFTNVRQKELDKLGKEFNMIYRNSASLDQDE